CSFGQKLPPYPLHLQRRQGHAGTLNKPVLRLGSVVSPGWLSSPPAGSFFFVSLPRAPRAHALPDLLRASRPPYLKSPWSHCTTGTIYWRNFFVITLWTARPHCHCLRHAPVTPGGYRSVQVFVVATDAGTDVTRDGTPGGCVRPMV
ncbi:hypothetical protein AVDCRST_MAG82-1813, partial [uncultured Rubrobacteraceae bacterium]